MFVFGVKKMMWMDGVLWMQCDFFLAGCVSRSEDAYNGKGGRVGGSGGGGGGGVGGEVRRRRRRRRGRVVVGGWVCVWGGRRGGEGAEWSGKGGGGVVWGVVGGV